ncbi:MAG TPA: DinB family protein [Terriglobales bacterium]|nr:DinB family protein [Terriglobales bacterium]
MERKRFRVLSMAAFCLFSVSLSMAQSSGAPVAQKTLTPEERAAALKSLQATHDAFLQSISGLSEKQWRFKPAPDRWSIAEVSEHITVAEGMILGFVQGKIMTGPATPEKRAEVKVTDVQILTLIPERTHKVQAPDFLKPTGRFATREQTVQAFEQARKATMDYVSTTNDDLRDHFGPHPMLGTLDAYQYILLISAHSERHTKQIEEVKADPNYPKE